MGATLGRAEPLPFQHSKLCGQTNAYCYNVGMIVTLTGENDFGLRREQQRIVKDFVAKHGDLALERLDGEEADAARIREAVTGLPFLADRKLVILYRPGSNKQFTESFEQWSAEIPETNNIILVEPKLDKRLGYYKFLRSKTDFREFPELDQSALARWLETVAKEQGGSLSSSDARYLIGRVGPNQQLLSNELEKLLLYDPKVTRQTIDAMTDETPQSTVFQLLEAAFAGQTEKVLTLYAEQRAQKVEPPQIIALLAWQLHVLATIKAAGRHPPDQIAKEAKLNPFVVRRSQGIARNLTLARLRSLISRLLEVDAGIKNTGIDPDEALQHYLLTVR